MQSFADLRGLYENVNNIFDRRIEETMEAKRKLERELARVSEIIQSIITWSIIPYYHFEF
jgi:hypothetical protein